LLYWYKSANTDELLALAATSSSWEQRVSVLEMDNVRLVLSLLAFAGTKVQILTPEELRARLRKQRSIRLWPWQPQRRSRYSVYLLYWYKSTNKVQILTPALAAVKTKAYDLKKNISMHLKKKSRPRAHLLPPHLRARYSLYLLYWYKITNTDAAHARTHAHLVGV
jgi:hypothetical protein